MQTGFVFFTVIVLAVSFAIVVGNNPTQIAGQPAGSLPSAITGPVESPGLSVGPGLKQREFK